MSNKEHLYRVVQSIIKDDKEAADIALHAYLTEKFRDLFKSKKQKDQEEVDRVNKDYKKGIDVAKKINKEVENKKNKTQE